MPPMPPMIPMPLAPKRHYRIWVLLPTLGRVSCRQIWRMKHEAFAKVRSFTHYNGEFLGDFIGDRVNRKYLFLILEYVGENFGRTLRPPFQSLSGHCVCGALRQDLPRSRRYSSFPFPACSRRHRQTQEHHNFLVEPNHILVVQPADPLADLGLRDGGDLVHRQPGRGAQAVALARLHRQPEQGRLGRVRGEGADRDGVRRIEAVILHDDDGAGFVRWSPKTGQVAKRESRP